MGYMFRRFDKSILPFGDAPGAGYVYEISHRVHVKLVKVAVSAAKSQLAPSLGTRPQSTITH
jgi:hypothetical protein